MRGLQDNSQCGYKGGGRNLTQPMMREITGIPGRTLGKGLGQQALTGSFLEQEAEIRRDWQLGRWDKGQV